MTLRDNLADRISGGRISEQAQQIDDQGEQITELQEVNHQQSNDLFMIRESLQRLEQVLYSSDWQRMVWGAQQEFTREGIHRIIELARLMRLKNPVVKRGVKLQRLYVWAQGVNITARDEQVNEVVQSFLKDEQNRRELTGHQARGEQERNLQQDGNLFIRFFIDPQTGRVRIAFIDPLEMDTPICNPDNKNEPWFYKRTWNQTGIDGSMEQRTEYYPDWQFTPRFRFNYRGQLGGNINWDTPVMHVAVNRLGRWGIPEFYDSLDWTRAYKSFLEQLASVWQALARWAAKLTVKGGKRGVAAAKTKLGTTMTGGQSETNPTPVTGSMFIGNEGTDLQPFRTAGATMSAEDGRRLFLMGAMSFGFPETFYGDADKGSLATAKSLDRPTELQIKDRQTLWTDIHMNIFSLVTLWAVKAPQGPLRGLARIERGRDGEQTIEGVIWNDNTDPTIDMDFPSIIEHDIKELITSIIDAQTLMGRSEGPGVPLETTVKRMLSELGFEDIDSIMEEWQAIQDERKAQAEALANQMQGDDDDDDEEDDEIDDDDETVESIRRRIEANAQDLLIKLRENGHNGNHR